MYNTRKMIQNSLLMICVCFFMQVAAQNSVLADSYFEKGDFEKAKISYEELYNQQPNNTLYLTRLVACYQQLEQFDQAIKILKPRIEKFNQFDYYVELGYTYQLQKKENQATKYYQQAVDKVRENPNYVYTVAAAFEKRSLLEYAIQTYDVAKFQNPNLNFDYQKGQLYGQLGDFDKMIDIFIDDAYNLPQHLSMIQHYMARYMSEDVGDEFKNKLKKALLLRAQKKQDVFWNQFLSWYYIQNKEFDKAFRQQKAVVKQNPELFNDIVNLVYLAMDENDLTAVQEISAFVLEQTISDSLRLSLQQYILSNQLKTLQPEAYQAFEMQIKQLIDQYGANNNKTVDIQLVYAHFITFYKKDPQTGEQILKQLLTLSINETQQAKIKTELGDVFLYQEKFNPALIYYSQVAMDLKDNPVGHEANLRVAKTSYYKGDFEWALKQLKVLKSSSSQLIANDALELYLLITDNNQTDTTQTALKKMAQADFKLYQQKYDEALLDFIQLAENHTEDKIQETTYIRIGKIYENKQQLALAIQQYELLAQKFPESIFIDEALFFSANLYLQTQQPEKAKSNYEQIILKYPDSIYFSEAQLKYRMLRGDTQS